MFFIILAFSLFNLFATALGNRIVPQTLPSSFIVSAPSQVRVNTIFPINVTAVNPEGATDFNLDNLNISIGAHVVTSQVWNFLNRSRTKEIENPIWLFA